MAPHPHRSLPVLPICIPGWLALLVVLLLLAGAGGLAGKAWADELAPPDAGDKAAEKPAGPPPKVDRSHNIDFLFEALKLAPDDDTARHIERRIWTLWFASGSDTADLLMSRTNVAIEAGDNNLAIRLLDAIVVLKPDYVEAWNRRSSIYFAKHDYGRAMEDLAQVLAREPRHFGALTELGLILQDVGDDKQALGVFQRALTIDPRLEKVPDLVKTLREKVEGRSL